MGPVQATKTCLRKYATFSGRASRSEYCWFFCDYALSILIFGYLGHMLLDSVFAPVFFTSVFYFLPLFAVTVRRLRDANRNIWLASLYLTPVVATLTAGWWMYTYVSSAPTILGQDPLLEQQTSMVSQLLILVAATFALCHGTLLILCSKAESGPNTYGPNPNEVPT